MRRFAEGARQLQRRCRAEARRLHDGHGPSRLPSSLRASRPRKTRHYGEAKFAPKASSRPSQSFTANSRVCQGVLSSPRVNSTPRAAYSA